jgi:hypothetical protein
MADMRKPVTVPIQGVGTFSLELHWGAGSGPVLTGDDSMVKATVRVDGTNAKVKGGIQLKTTLTSPLTGWSATPTRWFRFEVDPGAETTVEVDNDWMFVEGKVVYLLTAIRISGLQPNDTIPVDHPIGSFTVFERSTYIDAQSTSRRTLWLAGAAAAAAVASAILAAVVAYRV